MFFFEKKEDKILFIDFGFAVNMENFENLKRYEGTTHFASNTLLQIINDAKKQRNWPFHEPSVKDDLESLIKTFYCLIFPHKARELQGIDKFACDKLLTFWNEVFSNNDFFKKLVDLCENKEYDDLIGQFKAFLF